MKTTKFWVALVTAGLEGVAGVLPVQSTATQWVMFGLGVLGAAAVYLIPNTPAKTAAPAAEPYNRPGV